MAVAEAEMVRAEDLKAEAPIVEGAPKKQDPRRDYVVLMEVDVDTWKRVGRANGTREEALDEVVDGLADNEQANRFVPVPARSWKPAGRKTIVKSRWS
jgi:hypothetical protein